MKTCLLGNFIDCLEYSTIKTLSEMQATTTNKKWIEGTQNHRNRRKSAQTYAAFQHSLLFALFTSDYFFFLFLSLIRFIHSFIHSFFRLFYRCSKRYYDLITVDVTLLQRRIRWANFSRPSHSSNVIRFQCARQRRTNARGKLRENHLKWKVKPISCNSLSFLIQFSINMLKS